MKYHMIIDTETSGLPNNQHAAPIQVGVAVLGPDLNLAYTDSWYVMPRIIDTASYRGAQKVHGISLATLEQYAFSSEASVEKLKSKWLEFGRPQLYAYNVSFDELMIQRMGWAPGGYWGPCLMNAATSYLQRPKKVKLVEACNALGVPGPGGDAHDALADAVAAANVGRAIGAFV